VRTDPGARTKDARQFRQELLMICRRGWQVWQLVPRKHRLALGAAALVMAATSVGNTALPLLLGRLVDTVRTGVEGDFSRERLYAAAALYLTLIAGTYVFRESFHILRRYLVESTCTRIDRDMTTRLVGHLLKVDLATFTHEKVGSLNGRIARSVTGFVRFLRLGFLDFFPAFLTGAFALSATIAKQPWLGAVMLGVIPISLFLTVWQLTSQKDIRLKLIRSREVMDGTVVEQLSGIDFVRVANTHHEETKRVEDAAEHRRADEIRHHFAMSLFGSGKALNEAFFHILVLGCAIRMAIAGSISIGDILTFSILFLNVMMPLSEIHRVIDEAHESSLQVNDLLQMLSEPVDRSFEPATIQHPYLHCRVPIIDVHNLGVDYRTKSGSHVRALQGVSISIEHGQIIGVAGRSGSGKSTWLRVLMRLIHPREGSVFLGGIPLESISRESIGNLVGYVGQAPFVFAGTVAENIAYGNKNVTVQDVERAAKRAFIHDEIMAWPGGYQTMIAERGINLSGGQKQRIALARIFLKDPPILILDEGTSALDNISERFIQRTLLARRADRTVILVAHRLSSLRAAHRIFVFDEGRIVERGSYDQLVNRGGAFAELVRSAEKGISSLTDAPEDQFWSDVDSPSSSALSTIRVDPMP
jgi:ATP-binding cassette subfamily B protein